jgi:thiol-disulfide isomerase/thioredoxin
MRRSLLVVLGALLLGPLLAACGPSSPAQVTQARSHVDVASPDLVAFKKRTDIPDCPRLPATKAKNGMPDVTLPCLGGGRSVDLAGLRGPMIVNFWASWCSDCRKEMPALAAYAKSQSAVKVFGIDYIDTQPGAALELARSSAVGYPLVADPGGTLDRAAPLPHIPGLPITAFVDAKGAIVRIEAGSMLTRADVAAAAKKYLGVGG